MPDEPTTLGEVVRRFDDRFLAVREDIQQLVVMLDKKVSQEVYDLRHEVLAERVRALEVQREKDAALREKDAEKIVATRRWLIGAVVVPLVGVVVPLIVILLQGGRS
ncbi:hypothetical protein [Streptomyces angustmyceticus]|uniref:hypothetical protein n=1 Tax=Streptomyces angustmyceticus TaxID=285578 RepID=UPI00344CD958